MAVSFFKTEIEKQYGNIIKVVRSDNGDKYYDRSSEFGQQMGAFVKYLQECEIVAQHTMPGTPERCD